MCNWWFGFRICEDPASLLPQLGLARLERETSRWKGLGVRGLGSLLLFRGFTACLA